MPYAPRILKEEGDFDGIRYAAGLDDIYLPDVAILSPGMLPAVEARIVKSCPGFASLDADATLMLRSAVTKLTAAAALRAVPDSERSLDYDVTRRRKEQADEMVRSAEEDLSQIDGFDEGIPTPDVVRLSGPTRERKRRGQGIPFQP